MSRLVKLTNVSFVIPCDGCGDKVTWETGLVVHGNRYWHPRCARTARKLTTKPEAVV